MTDPAPAIFFDDGLGLLAPLRDLRPVFEVRTGALTTRERLTRALELRPVALYVQDAHAPLASGDLPINSVPDCDGPVLVLNGRCPLPLDVMDGLEAGQAAVEAESGDLIAARVAAPDARRLLDGEAVDLDTVAIEDRVLLTRPWHVRTFRDPCLATDLALLARDLPEAGEGDCPGAGARGCFHVGDHPLLIAPDARVSPASVFDTTGGPIAIGPGATIRPASTVIGPVSIGEGSTVLDRALVKASTAIGPVCKVAGEIGGTILQGYSNKGHDGHLGDSWLGEWVNLGAGTTNSNLLNTYSEVTAVAQPHAHREKTGETFFGCVLGDHVKTAIGTRIMTGAIVHTGAMWAASGPITGCVDRFAWATDAGVRRYRTDRFLEVMRASMSRREITPTGAYEQRIRDLASETGD
jgi:UDP-N-acetylglucosamine diphosphorylase/glucosamine-1-phosphate N-acetyltransferase